MARISTYAVDNNINAQDKVLGSDSLGNGTKNYTFQGIVDWFNASGAVAILGQNNYFFQSEPTPLGRLPGTISFDALGGVGTLFSAITEFKMSEKAVTNYTLENYVPTIVGETIMLAQLNNLNLFGVYRVISATRDIDEPLFYNVALSFIDGFGGMAFDEFYGIALYAGNAENGDKNYIYTQNTPSAVWNITHNLDKYPSVTAVNINNIVYYGNVTYIDTDNLTIEFSAGFSGKAYLN
jgi:hypothetical protein